MPIQKLSVTTYMADVRNLLRPVSFMDIAQEIATVGAKQLHFDDSVTVAAANAVWVLARMRVCFHRMPVRYEDITLETWHKGICSVFFLRDYRVRDAQGEVLIDATSSWVIMEKDQRRMLRPDGLTDVIPPDPEQPGHALETPAGKIVMGMPFYGRGKEGYADFVDYKDIPAPLKGHKEKWDPKAKVPYYADAEGRLVFSFDNVRSIGEKCLYILKNGLLGGMYWEYCCDNADSELARTVAEQLLPRPFVSAKAVRAASYAGKQPRFRALLYYSEHPLTMSSSCRMPLRPSRRNAPASNATWKKAAAGWDSTGLATMTSLRHGTGSAPSWAAVVSCATTGLRNRP